MVDSTWRTILWRQFGAAIDMLENAVVACPEHLWNDRSRSPAFWYLTYHTLFYLDLYLSDSPEGFSPPPPFGLDELDPAAVLPDGPYAKSEIGGYVAHGREKCRAVIDAMTEDTAAQRCGFSWLDLTRAELLLYNMRHVQHHAGQLNLILRQTIDSAPGWVKSAGAGPFGR
jgi:hypothetical protein